MLSSLRNKSLDFFESIVNTLEQYETGQLKNPEQEAKVPEDQKTSTAPNDSDEDLADPSSKDSLKRLSFKLIDLGIHRGQAGLELIQQSAPYTYIDENLEVSKKVKQAQEEGVRLYKFVSEKVYNPMMENLYLLYDQAGKYFSLFMKVVQENQQKIIDYVKTHYENV